MRPPTSVEQINEWLNVKTETKNLEFKAAKTQFSHDNLLNYCVAIANELGGYLLLGITNKRPRQVIGTQAFQNVQETELSVLTKLGFRVDIQEVPHPDGRVIVETTGPNLTVPHILLFRL